MGLAKFWSVSTICRKIGIESQCRSPVPHATSTTRSGRLQLRQLHRLPPPALIHPQAVQPIVQVVARRDGGEHPLHAAALVRDGVRVGESRLSSQAVISWHGHAHATCMI